MISVYVESGSRRCFAGAVEWPGWCRSGRDEPSALEALLDYLPRYRRAVGSLSRGLPSLRGDAELDVVERLAGGSTTDFGAPGVAPAADDRPIGGDELSRQLGILKACWSALDATAAAARGRELATGPRGGGRSLADVVAHVDGGDVAYLSRLGGQVLKDASRAVVREAFVRAVKDRAGGLTPDEGPRGGRRWSARYGIRRSAWHVLDHAWEIEDRVI